MAISNGYSRCMSEQFAQQLSRDLATAVAKTSPGLVFTRGRRGRAASGTIVDAQSIVVSEHLLDADQTIRVQTSNGDVDARVIGRDAGTDIALLQVDGSPLTPVSIASDPPAIGQVVMAVGRSWSGLVAYPGFVTQLSGPHHVWPGFRLEHAIHTTLEPFAGFSGGALVNGLGYVVGVSTSALERGRGVAIPMADVSRVVESLKKYGRLRRGYLGITSLPISLPLRQRTDGSERGLLVTSVAADSPADRAQVLVGDILVAIDGTPAKRPDDLAAHLTGERVGQVSVLHLVRGLQPVRLDVTVGERSADAG
jgi:S1-C subfamily serine protease